MEFPLFLKDHLLHFLKNWRTSSPLNSRPHQPCFCFNIIIAIVTIDLCYYHVTYAFQSKSTLYSCPNVNPKETGCKLNIHKTFRRRPGHLLNVLCTFNLCPVSTGKQRKLLARNRRDIWSVSDSNGVRTHNRLVCKRTRKIIVFTPGYLITLTWNLVPVLKLSYK